MGQTDRKMNSAFTISPFDQFNTLPYNIEDSYINNPNDTSSGSSSVADAEFDKEARVIILWVEIILGTIGGFMVCIWLWYNRRRRSRVNLLILHVAVTDLMVIYGACFPQLLWEYFDRYWSLGNAACKLLKFTQSIVLIASNYMVIVLSIDRHQAIRAPLKEPIPVWLMTTVSWVVSGILSLPMFYIFKSRYVTSPGPFQNMTVCESIFRTTPKSARQAFLTFISVVHFCIPFIILVFCYTRIFLKISGKAKESKSGKQTIKPGKVYLQSTASSSLTRAKVKTLKMTLVIVLSFIICVLPYHIVEAIFNFGDHRWVPKVVYAILGGMATANSATNPFVFLLFNTNLKCARSFLASIFPCGKSRDTRAYLESTVSTRSEYAMNRSEYTVNTDITRTISKYSPSGREIETVEMADKKTQQNGPQKGNYTLMTSRQQAEEEDHSVQAAI